LPGRILSDSLGLSEEVRQSAVVEMLLLKHTALEELLASGLESAVEGCKEVKSIISQDRLVLLFDRSCDLYSLRCHIV